MFFGAEDTTMKISSKIPKMSSERHIELINDQWVQLKEPRNLITSMLWSIPIMFLNALVTIGIIHIIMPISLANFNINLGAFSVIIDLYDIIGLIILLMIHEFLHLILIPNFIRSDKTYVGITPLAGFVYTEEELSKSRYIIITIAPFVLISIIATVIFGSMGILTPLITILILLNSMASSVDILMLILILFQAPANSYITSNGMNTYWKLMQNT